MSTADRKRRARADRERLIIDTARAIAEAEGWDAVTVRRLAESIEYSQPVLYSHFAGKDAIVAAVALDGCVELAEAMRAARENAGDARAALTAVVEAYAAFAHRSPALFAAIFTLPTGLDFGGADAPEPLIAAFAELMAVLAPFAGEDPETFTEMGWSAVHGQVMLAAAGRLRPERRDERLHMLVGVLAGDGSGASVDRSAKP